MAHPRGQEPIKHCANCGKLLRRKRINGRLEDLAVFKRRKYCDLTCSGQGRRKEHPGKSALLKRATVYRKSECEACGTTQNLGTHHIDGNQANNAPSNLMTLCGSCHTKWHWEHGKTMPNAGTSCKICGAQSVRLWRGMCQKHYRRYKKYGDPYLSKRKYGSQYELVRID
jgi:hypothetical protein